MLHNDAFLRQLEQLADIVKAYREGQESGKRVERQIEVVTGLSMHDIATLPTADVVPPIADARLRRDRAMGVADALFALGFYDKSFRLVEVAAEWRTDDELEAEHWRSRGEKARVWIGEVMACVRTIPRSLRLPTTDGVRWSPSDGPGVAPALCI